MLKMWRERNGSEATDEKLVYALSITPQCKQIQEKGEKFLEEQRNNIEQEGSLPKKRLKKSPEKNSPQRK